MSKRTAWYIELALTALLIPLTVVIVLIGVLLGNPDWIILLLNIGVQIMALSAIWEMKPD